MSNESLAGPVILMGLCFLIYGVAVDAYKAYEPAVTEVCTVGFVYMGRDDNGRPTWNYPEVCYED